MENPPFNRYEREVIEALEIRNYSDRIMNGCAGRNVNISFDIQLEQSGF